MIKEIKQSAKPIIIKCATLKCTVTMMLSKLEDNSLSEEVVIQQIKIIQSKLKDIENLTHKFLKFLNLEKYPTTLSPAMDYIPRAIMQN